MSVSGSADRRSTSMPSQLSIIIAAVAVGAYFGTEHKRQGVDIVSRLLTTTGVRAPVSQPNPVPRYDAVSHKLPDFSSMTYMCA